MRGMNFFLVLLLLMSFLHPCYGQQWISLSGNNTPQAPMCIVSEYGDHHIVIDVEIFGFYVENVVENNTTFQILRFPEFFTLSDTGRPALPIISKLIQIPKDSDISVSIENASAMVLSGYYVYPFQTDLLEKEVADSFYIDTSLYSTDLYYPATIFNYSESMSFRDIEVVNLVLNPIKFNPYQSKLEITTSFQIRIDFEKQFNYVSTHFSKSFDRIFNNTVLNYNSPTTFSPPKSGDYNLLIIASDEFIASPNSKINDFIKWKNQKGYKTKLVSIEYIFGDYDHPYDCNTFVTNLNYSLALKWFIRNEFATNNIEYVLFIGDANYIPGSHEDFGVWSNTKDLPGDEEPEYLPNALSDYWYGCLSHSSVPQLSFFPTVNVGRFSVKNVSELNNIIDKTLAYEKNPPVTDWIQKCLLIAHKEDAPLKYEKDKEDIKSTNFPYNITWKTAYGSNTSVNNQTIIAAINEGVGVVNYRGHGTLTGWRKDWSFEDIAFNETQLALLANNTMTPVVFSIACANNSLCLLCHSCEHDDDYADECLGETFTRSNTGAVAFYGASTPTSTLHNSFLDKMIFNILYDEGQSYFGPPLYSISEITSEATLGMLNHFTHASHGARLSARVYLWLGDPTLEVWTDIPQELNISYTPNYIEDAIPHNVSVSVNNLPSGKTAKITLYKENEIFESQTITGSGTVNFTVTPITSGEIDVTVTSHNYLPFQGTIAVMTCNYNNTPLIIKNDEIWNIKKCVGGNIIIEEGKKLTITNEVILHPGSKIIVKQGSRLILDGGSLGNSCNDLWQGIELWGNSSASQLTFGVHGRVELKNGAVIENALCGVFTSKKDEYGNIVSNTTGGIIQGKNSTFSNCKTAVEFLPYQNTHPVNGNLIHNISYFTNCEFETNEDYLPTQGAFQEFVKMHDVTGVKFYGNIFKNTIPNIPVWARGKGITAINSEFILNPYCSQTIIAPCPDQFLIKNTFENLYYAVDAQNYISANSVKINECEFSNNFRSIALKNIHNATITNNNFEIAENYQYDYWALDYSYGLSLENCTGYRVEENKFGSNHSNAGFGVIMQNSGTAPNQIYNNTFENLNFAVRAQGNNGGSFASLKSGGTSMPVYLSSGLVIKCNDFSQINTADISVTSGSIAPNQNKCSNDTRTPANNLFSLTSQGVFPYNIWINPVAGNIKYSVNTDGTTAPLSFTINKVNIATCITTFDESSSCPSFLMPTLPYVYKQQITLKSMYAQNLASQFDGGNTQAMLDNVYQNKPAGQLKNTLLAASPYLSDTVLLAAVKHKPSPLPPGILKEILVPNSPLSPSVMQAVVGRTPSLPGGIMNEINAVQHGISERELLEKELVYVEGEIAMLEKMLIQTWLADTTYNGRDSVIAWFECKPQTTEIQQYLVEAYMANAQLVDAVQMLSQLTQTTAGDSAFVAYYTILTDLYLAGENIFSLTPAQEQTIRQIAESETSVSGNAQVVLWLVYGDEYELIIEELLLPDSMSIYGYLSSGAFCDYMPVAGDTLFLVDENMEPVAGMPYAVTNDDGYFIFNTHHFIFADTTKLYGISTKSAYQIEDVVFAPLHQLISSSPLELTHGDVRLEWFDLYAGPDSIYAIGTKIDLNGNIYVGGRTFQLNPLVNNVFLVKYSPQGERLWETVYNAGVTHLHEYLFDLETDNNGNSYMLFYSATTNDVLLKFDDMGQLMWTAAVDNIPNKKFRGINIEFDIYGNIIVAGHMDDYSQQPAKTDFFVAKFNENGQKIWLQFFNMSHNDNVMSMNTDKNGNIVLSGYYYTNSIKNGIVICFDNNGSLLWTNTYITGGEDIASVVKTDFAGNVYVAGNTDYMNGFLLKYSSNGNLLWTDNEFCNFIPRVLIVDSENMLYVGMEKWTSTYDYISYSVRKYNENGNVLWQSTYENSDLYAARFNSVTIDNNNYLYASGYAMPDDSTENSVAVTVKMDFDGNFVRTDIFSVPNGIKHQGNNLVVSENNNIYVAGQCYDTEAIKMFTVKYSQCHSQSGLRADQWYPDEENDNESEVLPVLSNHSLLVYPNPYSGQTTIELSLDEASAVRAEIYTITGQRVCSLHEGNLQQGTHSFIFSAYSHGFSAGVYILKIFINNESMHRMLIEME